MNTPIVIIGAGGHASVVAEALLAAGETVLGFTDANPSQRQGRCGLPVLGDDGVLESMSRDAVRLANGIGSVEGADLRSEVQRRLQREGWRFAQARHPSAIVSPYAQLGVGVQLLAGSIVQAYSCIKEGCIVNTAAVVEHDVELGEYVHVAPGAVVCGSARVGTMSHIGAGAVVRQGLTLGSRTVLGVGAVVVKDTDGAAVWVGSPARRMAAKT